MLTALAVAVLAISCSKADSSSQTGSAPPVNKPGASGATAVKGGGTEGAIPSDQPGNPATNAGEFQLDVVPQPAAGLEQAYKVSVAPGKGFHMNKDYPTKLTLELPAGVSSPKPILLAEDAAQFTEQALSFDVKLAAAAKGEYTIPATLKFAVCTDSTCNPKKQALSLKLAAQ